MSSVGGNLICMKINLQLLEVTNAVESIVVEDGLGFSWLNFIFRDFSISKKQFQWVRKRSKDFDQVFLGVNVYIIDF